MALTAYCKKCGKEVDAGERCPYCGTSLGKTSAHAAWCVERTPVRDWLCWNAVMRLLLPAALAVLVLVLLLEGLSGGISAVEKLLTSGFPTVLLMQYLTRADLTPLYFIVMAITAILFITPIRVPKPQLRGILIMVGIGAAEFIIFILVRLFVIRW